jgi:hypothetical protein
MAKDISNKYSKYWFLPNVVNTFNLHPFDISEQGWSETCGCPGQANNLVPPFKLFWSTRGLVNLLEDMEKCFNLWKPEFTSTIFLTIPIKP